MTPAFAKAPVKLKLQVSFVGFRSMSTFIIVQREIKELIDYFTKSKLKNLLSRDESSAILWTLSCVLLHVLKLKTIWLLFNTKFNINIFRKVLSRNIMHTCMSWFISVMAADMHLYFNCNVQVHYAIIPILLATLSSWACCDWSSNNPAVSRNTISVKNSGRDAGYGTDSTI